MNSQEEILKKIKVVGTYPGQNQTLEIDDTLFLSNNDLEDEDIIEKLETIKENEEKEIEKIDEKNVEISKFEFFESSSKDEKPEMPLKNDDNKKEENTKEKINQVKDIDNKNNKTILKGIEEDVITDGLNNPVNKHAEVASSYYSLNKTLALSLIKNTKDKNITTNELTKEDLEPIFNYIITSITKKEKLDNSIFNNLVITLAKRVINNAIKEKITTHGLSESDLVPIWEFIIKNIER